MSPLSTRVARIIWYIGIGMSALGGTFLWGVALSGAYLSEALRSHDISETVTVGGRVYEVVMGKVYENDTSIGGLTAARSLRVAYAVTLARRSPLMNLAGTNPEALRRSVDMLDATLPKLSAAAPDSKKLIAALYPTKYLQSLATLEENRQNLLRTQSAKNADTYEESLRDAQKEGARALSAFEKEFSAVAHENKQLRIPSIGGTITPSALLSAIDSIQSGFAKTQSLSNRRSLCVRGFIWVCQAEDITLPHLLPLPSAEVLSDRELERVRDVRNMFASALVQPNLLERRMAVISTSTCLSTLPGPYVFSYPSRPEFDPGSLPYLLNDIFFTPTDERAPMLDHLREKLDIAFSFANPLVFYRCPDVGLDISKIVTISTVSNFVGAHPEIARNWRRLSGAHLRSYQNELDTIRILGYALTETSEQREAHSQILEMMLMMRSHGAGLERIVLEIAETHESHLRARSLGLSVDIDGRTLALLQSAFPTLYQAYNPSFGGTFEGVRAFGTPPEDDKLYTYSKLRETHSREDLVNDLQSFFSFERP